MDSETKLTNTTSGGTAWQCSFCSTLNKLGTDQCLKCHKTQKESNENYFTTKDEQAKSIPKKVYHKIRKIIPTTPISKNFYFIKNHRKIAVSLLLTGLLSAASILYFSTRNKENYTHFTVTQKNWHRVVTVESLVYAQREDWIDEIKGEVIKIIEKKRKIRGYEDIVKGHETETLKYTKKTNLGVKEQCQTTYYRESPESTPEKRSVCKEIPIYKKEHLTEKQDVWKVQKEAVYDTLVTYITKTYVPTTQEIKKGSYQDPIEWPNVKLEKAKQERIKDKIESYFVTLTSPEKTITIKAKHKQWKKQYSLGEKIALKEEDNSTFLRDGKKLAVIPNQNQITQ